ncbi:MAG: hypothetical protein DDT38_01330 [Firmicutes bacterium]|nr:hypothetical protein [candidate division NPL-UPA2 bacterium]
MITIVIVDATIAAGRVVVPGELVELSKQEGELLIAMGRARLAGKILTDPLAVRETTERKPPEKRGK